ncbi:permease [Cytobacillus depressus]|uniref:Permease n=1 Tax=Cytobacillus depressus TaxID=1602942 RepID=A0A6L3V837_9BACI|nr:permease [Cytobacillus depressus]
MQRRTPKQWNSSFLALLCLAIIFILYFFSTNDLGSIPVHPQLQIFKTIFISIILEAMPFILIGVFISALLQVFVSEQTIKRMIPKNPVLGIITASVIGIIFPICECGMVPAIRKLIKKGMPLYAAVTFILVGPILNPIVFWSTWTAFRNRPEITYSRMGLAFLVALVVGLIVYRLVKTNQLRDHDEPIHHKQNKEKFKHSKHHHQHSSHKSKRPSKVIEVMGHATSEFFEMGKYLVFGAMLVGLLQTIVAQSTLISLGQGPVSSNLLMMGLGFILSLCSTSDAFVAQSFTNTFSKSSLVVFMVFGPMINLKGILMMSAVFKPRFVILLSALVFFFVLAGALLLEWFVL